MMEHMIVKAILISDVVELIASNYKIATEDARDRLYSSPVIDWIDDDDTGLYGDSAYYIFSVYEQYLTKLQKSG